MPSPSDSTSSGSAAPTADAPRRRRSLGAALGLAFVPLCAVVTFGTVVLSLDARRVHGDLQRLFEEQREIGVVRGLLDELQGLDTWIRSVPEARRSTHALVLADVGRHLAGARDALTRFVAGADPSRAAHEDEERLLLGRVAAALDAVAATADADRGLGGLAAPLADALQAARVLAHAVESEGRAIGNDLDERTDHTVDLLWLLGGATLLTAAGLGLLLVRRVLRPVRALRASAIALGRGAAAAPVVSHHGDELGELAESFAAMASRLQRARAELEERVEARSREVLRSAQLAELGTLAAGVAHEINNPLASIATCAEGLLRDAADGGLPPRVRDYLQIVQKEAMRARDITTRLLRLAHHGPGRRDRVDLAVELREVAPMFAHQLQSAGVALDLDLPAGEAVLVGAAAEWRQVLFNLLRNALDASPRGGTVRVRLGRDYDRLVLEVLDDGPGIAPEALERVFEPFFTTKPPGQGTGLGLAIVHRIVAAHGGEVTAANRAPHGACFRITVPAAGG